jgi:hypothetical protein
MVRKCWTVDAVVVVKLWVFGLDWLAESQVFGVLENGISERIDLFSWLYQIKKKLIHSPFLMDIQRIFGHGHISLIKNIGFSGDKIFDTLDLNIHEIIIWGDKCDLIHYHYMLWY